MLPAYETGLAVCVFIAFDAGASSQVAYFRIAVAVLCAEQLALVVATLVSRWTVGVLDTLRAGSVVTHVGEAFPAGGAIPIAATAGLADSLHADLAGLAFVVACALGFLLAAALHTLIAGRAMLVAQALDTDGVVGIAMRCGIAAVAVRHTTGTTGMVHTLLAGVTVAVLQAFHADARTGFAVRSGRRAVGVAIAGGF
jgi:hypothetical protein